MWEHKDGNHSLCCPLLYSTINNALCLSNTLLLRLFLSLTKISDWYIYLYQYITKLQKQLSRLHSCWVHHFWTHSQEEHPGCWNIWKELPPWWNTGIWEKGASHVTYTSPAKCQALKLPEPSKTVPQIENLFPNIWAYRGHFAQKRESPTYLPQHSAFSLISHQSLPLLSDIEGWNTLLSRHVML